jgi:hypothetical protein
MNFCEECVNHQQVDYQGSFCNKFYKWIEGDDQPQTIPFEECDKFEDFLVEISKES